MINNRNNKFISASILMLSDIVSILIPALFIYTFYDKVNNQIVFRKVSVISLFMLISFLLLYLELFFQQYSVRRSLYDEFIEFTHVYLYTSLASLSLLFILDLSVERYKHIEFLAFVFITLPSMRFIARIILERLGFWKIKCFLFCPISERKYVIKALESQRNLGMTVVRSGLEQRYLVSLLNKTKKIPIAEYSKIKKLITDYHFTQGSPHIIILNHNKISYYMPKLVELIEYCGLPYSIVPDIGSVSLLGMRISHFFAWEFLLLTPQNNNKKITHRAIKRIFDIVISAFLLILLFLPMLVIYLLVRIDGGPAIYVHERIGYNGQMFGCLKFRSMKVGAQEILNNYLTKNNDAFKEWKDTQKLQFDPRITRLGKILRTTSLDELPQLFNVLYGSMSLVGPRPITVDEIEKYDKYIEIYKQVRPGITGLWQISGRSNTSYEYRVGLDVWYIKNRSLLYDLAILIKTISVVLSRKGAR